MLHEFKIRAAYFFDFSIILSFILNTCKRVKFKIPAQHLFGF